MKRYLEESSPEYQKNRFNNNIPSIKNQIKQTPTWRVNIKENIQILDQKQ